MLFCCFSRSSGAPGEDMLLLFHPTAWPSGFSASMWVTWVEPPIHSSAPLEEGLLSSPHYLFGRRMLLFPWVISPPRRRENQVSSYHGKRCVPPSRRLSYYTLGTRVLCMERNRTARRALCGTPDTHQLGCSPGSRGADSNQQHGISISQMKIGASLVWG